VRFAAMAETAIVTASHAERTPGSHMLSAAEYFTRRGVEQPFEVDGLTSPAASTCWIRPLESYTEALTSSGLAITLGRSPMTSTAAGHDNRGGGSARQPQRRQAHHNPDRRTGCSTATSAPP
jgi:hypothetical protein